MSKFTAKRRDIIWWNFLAILALLPWLTSIAARADDAKQPPTTRPMRVVCFGDSITRVGYATVLGDRVHAEVINAGKSGNSTVGGLKRLQAEVLDQHPDVVVILFGTNDSRLAEPKLVVSVEQYGKNLETMITQCHAIGATVLVGTVPPIVAEPYFKRHARENFDKAGGLDKVLADYRQKAIDVATAHGAAVIDLQTLLAKRPEWVGKDGVHPSKEGRDIIADFVADTLKPILAGTTTRPATTGVVPDGDGK